MKAMRKGRGKGKISNDLVAASCAAVLVVYTAGYLRTRDAARRFETHAKAPRPAARTEPAAASPAPPVTAAPAPSLTPHVPEPPARVTARKPIPEAAVPQVAQVAAPSSPDGPHAIAPVPLPAEETTVAMPIAITRTPAYPAAPKWRDGTYTGLGDSPHGDIEARVIIRDGRIVEAAIATCDTRYPCEVINPLIHQPV